MSHQQADFTKENHSESRPFPRPGRPPRSGPTSRSPNQREKILNLLRERGRAGATNDDLVRIAYRYSARLREIRLAEYEVRTDFVREGVFKYTLISEPVEPKPLPTFQSRQKETAESQPPLFAEVPRWER